MSHRFSNMRQQPDPDPDLDATPSLATLTTLTTSHLPLPTMPRGGILSSSTPRSDGSPFPSLPQAQQPAQVAPTFALELQRNSSAVNGVVIGLLSSFGSAILIALIFIVVYFFKYTAGGRIFLDRIGRPGEYDDEQAFLREEAEALEEMDDLQRGEYLRAKGAFWLPCLYLWFGYDTSWRGTFLPRTCCANT